MITQQNHKVHLSAQDFERLRDLRAERPARNIPEPVLTPGAAHADWHDEPESPMLKMRFSDLR